MANIVTITNNILSSLSGNTSQVLLGDATLTDFKLDSLTDVALGTPGDGDVLKYNATTQLWEASDNAGITGTGASGRVAYFTGSTTQGGSNNLFWDITNSRLGINTSTPAFPLDVYRTTFGTIAQFYLLDGTNNPRLFISGTADGIQLFATYSSGAANLMLGTGGAERMRINASGNVGIGTTSPIAYFDGALSSRALQIVGSGRTGINLQDSSSINQYLNIGVNGANAFIEAVYSTTPTINYNAYSAHVFITGATPTEKMRINAAGNVGIGTPTPQTGVKLDVVGAAAIAGGSEGLRIGNLGDNTAYDNVKLYYTGYNSAVPRVYLIPRTTPGSGIVNTYFHLQNSNGSSTTSNNVMGLLVDGSVGIGTNAPTYKLDVVGAGNFSVSAGGASLTGTALTLTNTSDAASNGVRLAWRQATATHETAFISSLREGAESWSSLIFATSSVSWNAAAPTEKMRLTSTGRLGIGTTNPTERLVIQGNGAKMRIETGSAPTVYYTQMESNYDASNTFNITDGGANKFGSKALVTFNDTYINSFYNVYIATGTVGNTSANNIRLFVTQTGNIGIGTTAPTQKLQIAAGSIQLDDDYAVQWGGATNFILGSNASNYLRFYTNNSERLRITNTGNVGIGTSVPSQKLEVNGGAVGNNIARFTTGVAGGGTRGMSIYSNDSYVKLQVTDNTGNYASWAFLSLNPDGGNVGIGTTSPAETLQIGGFNTNNHIRINGYSATQNSNLSSIKFFHSISTEFEIARIQSGVGSTFVNDGYLSFFTGNAGSFTEKVRITETGNVGIGTTAPVGKLDIVGTLVTARFFQTGSLSLIGTDTTASAQTVLTLSTGVDNATGPNIILSKSRTQSNGSIVGGDVLGTIQFQGGNGTSSVESSRIQALSADVFSSTSRPSDLLFFTTAASTTTVTERMRIRANGNVGIGDTGPSSKLQVGGDIRVSGTGIAINGYSGGFFDFASGVFRIRAQETTGGAIAFMTAPNGLSNVSTERMRITDTGDVGIGTTTPNSKLHVAGNINAYHAGGTNAIIYVSKSDATTTVQLNSSGNSFLNGGNVGIGTTAPTTSLVVRGNTSGYDKDIIVWERAIDGLVQGALGYGKTSGGPADNNVYVGSITNHPLLLQTNNIERLRVTTAGNVGVGTSTPNLFSWASKAFTVVSSDTNTYAALEAYGQGTGAGALLLGSTSILRASIVAADGSHLVFATNTSNSGSGQNEKMRITSAGDVGIGVSSPVSKTEVYSLVNASTFTGITVTNAEGGGTNQSRAGIAFKTYDWVQSAIWQGRNISGNLGGALVFGTNPSTADLTVGGVVGRMWIINNGNVGVNISNPTYKLHVDGDFGAGIMASALTNGSVLLRDLGNNIANNAIEVHIRPSAGKSGYLTFTENAVADRWAIGIANASGNLRFIAGTPLGTEVMTITSSGNLGIGTSAPAYKLDVNGSFRALTSAGGSVTATLTNNVPAANATTGYGLLIESEASAATSYALTIRNLAGNNTYFHVSTATGIVGNVGIGTTTPGYRLDVVGSVAGGQFSGFRLWNNTTDTAGTYTEFAMPVFNGTGGFHIRSYGNSTDSYNTFISTGQSSSNLIFGSGALVERMRITSTGLIGMGTTTPTAGYRLTLATGGMILTGTQATAGVTGAIDTQGYTMANSNNQILNYFYANGVGNVFVTKLAAAVFRVQTSGTRYTTSTAYGIHVESAIKGVSTDIGSAYGIAVEDQTAGNTNNYGIWSNVSSGTNRWNIFVPGTANNYFAGNVGIGTTTPAYKLDVVGDGRFTTVNTTAYTNSNTLTSGTSLYIINNAVTNSTAATIRLDAVGGDGSLAAATISSVWVGSASSSLTFGTRSLSSDVTERMRITATGDVGIGTTLPSNILTLLRNQNATTALNVINTNVGTDSFSGVQLGSDIAGGTAYTSLVYATSGVTTNGAFRPNGTTLANYGAGGLNLFAQSQPIRFFTGADTGTERMVINNFGNIGIGTSSPADTYSYSRALDIQGVTGAGLYLRDSDTPTTTFGFIGYDGTGRGLDLIVNDARNITFWTTFSERMRLTSTGNFGIGTTSPQAKFVVSNGGEQGIEMGYSATYVANYIESYNRSTNTSTDLVYFLSGSAKHRFYGGGFERMSLDSSGNLAVDSTTLYVDAVNNEVGIGTSSPNSVFHVAGSVTMPISTKTANYTMTASDYTVLCDTNLGNITITLPAASGIAGRIYVIKKINQFNQVIIDGNASETIDGTTTFTILCLSSVMIQCDGTNWHVIADVLDTSCLGSPN